MTRASVCVRISQAMLAFRRDDSIFIHIKRALVSDLPIAARLIILRGVYRPKGDTGGVSWQPEAEAWMMEAA
jgi:hypothetical protein